MGRELDQKMKTTSLIHTTIRQANFTLKPHMYEFSHQQTFKQQSQNPQKVSSC